jgi:hypothetical protein
MQFLAQRTAFYCDALLPGSTLRNPAGSASCQLDQLPLKVAAPKRAARGLAARGLAARELVGLAAGRAGRFPRGRARRKCGVVVEDGPRGGPVAVLWLRHG